MPKANPLRSTPSATVAPLRASATSTFFSPTDMFTKDEAQKLGQKVLGYSTFPECQVTVTSIEEAYTRFANNGITTASLSMRRSVSVAVTRDGRTGQYGVDDLDDPSLKEAVRKAEELAAISPPNPERMPALGPQKYSSVSDFDEATANARAPQMIPHVKTIIDTATKRKLVAGLIERAHRITAITNKSGLFGFHEGADSQLTTTVRMPDGSSSGWAGQPSLKLSEIDSAKLAAAASEKCERWRNPQRLDPGNYTVVLEPTAAGDIVRLITSKTLTLIDKGVVANLEYDRYWASKTGKAPNGGGGGRGGFGGGFGQGGSALTLEGGSDATESLIASVDRGLLI